MLQTMPSENSQTWTNSSKKVRIHLMLCPGKWSHVLWWIWTLELWLPQPVGQKHKTVHPSLWCCQRWECVQKSVTEAKKKKNRWWIQKICLEMWLQSTTDLHQFTFTLQVILLVYIHVITEWKSLFTDEENNFKHKHESHMTTLTTLTFENLCICVYDQNNSKPRF